MSFGLSIGVNRLQPEMWTSPNKNMKLLIDNDFLFFSFFWSLRLVSTGIGI